MHALPSLHEAVLFACAQPEVGLQLSSVHGLLSLQFNDPVPGWQIPPPHVSPSVHGLPSLHEAVLFACPQPEVGLQLSSVQGFPSLQSSVPVPGWQIPAEQVSPVVQAFPSLHGALLLTCVHPVATVQESVVHGLPSSQFGPEPPTHTPWPLH